MSMCTSTEICMSTPTLELQPSYFDKSTRKRMNPDKCTSTPTLLMRSRMSSPTLIVEYFFHEYVYKY